MLVAARDAGVRRFVYAASSSTYGDHPGLPKVEDMIGRPLSPYAVTKYVDELYADVFERCYGIATVGLRYFNVFGPRQDPEGAYAAVIPRWVRAMLHGEPIVIHGDGETTRDFCYVANVVQANLLAATREGATGHVYNVAVGAQTSLNELFVTLSDLLIERHPKLRVAAPIHDEFRPGDVRHSQADITLARRQLGYEPTHDVRSGLRASLPWYERRFAANAVAAPRSPRVCAARREARAVRPSGAGQGRGADRRVRVHAVACAAESDAPASRSPLSDRVALARAYEHGEGVPKDPARAAALYCEAARDGDADAQYGLGWMYANGRGVARDDAVAASLFAHGGRGRARGSGQGSPVRRPRSRPAARLHGHARAPMGRRRSPWRTTTPTRSPIFRRGSGRSPIWWRRSRRATTSIRGSRSR